MCPSLFPFHQPMLYCHRHRRAPKETALLLVITCETHGSILNRSVIGVGDRETKQTRPKKQIGSRFRSTTTDREKSTEKRFFGSRFPTLSAVRHQQRRPLSFLSTPCNGFYCRCQPRGLLPSSANTMLLSQACHSYGGSTLEPLRFL